MSYPPCYEIIVVIRCSFDKYGRRLDLSRGQQAQLLRETGAAVHALVTSPPPKPFLQGLLGGFGVSLPHVSRTWQPSVHVPGISLQPETQCTVSMRGSLEQEARKLAELQEAFLHTCRKQRMTPRAQ